MNVTNRPLMLATKGQDVRLALGADVSSQLTAPLTVGVRTSREGG